MTPKTGNDPEKESARERELYRHALKKAGIMVFEQDTNLQYINIFNPAEVFGGKPCVGKTDNDLLNPDAATQFSTIKQQVLHSGKSTQTEVCVLFKNREYFFRLWLDAVFDKQGEITGISGSLTDTTAQKQAMDALHKSQERFKVVMHGTPAMVYTQDTNLRYTWINAPMPEQSTENVIGRTDNELFEPEVAKTLEEIKRSVIKNGKGRLDEVVISSKPENEDVVYEITTDPLFDTSGNISGIIGMSKDISRIKKDRQELANERELLSTIFDSIPVMLTLYEPTINVLFFNRAFHQVTGWTPEDVSQHDVMQLVYPDDKYRQQVAGYMKSLKPGFKDIQMVGKDGRVIESSWANIKIPDGRQVGIGVDISQRKHIEQALRESEERFAAAFRSSPDALLISELETGKILDVNDSWISHWGYSREGSLGRQTTNLGLYVNVEDRKKALRIVKKEGRLIDRDVFLKTSKGELRQAVLRMEPLNIRNKNLLLTIITDVTERKIIEQERERLLEENQSQKNFLETLLNSIKAGVAVLSGKEMRFTMVNNAYQDLRPGIPMTGKTLLEVFPGASKDGFEELVRKVVDTGEPFETTGFALPVEGKPDAVWDHQILRLPHGPSQIPSALIIIWETTAHKRMEHELRHYALELADANKELESFSYSVSHDMRTPLLTIASFSKLLIEEYSDIIDKQGNDYLKRIKAGVMKMERIIDDMLILSRIGRQELRCQELNLSQITRNILEEFIEVQPERKVKFFVSDNLHLCADPGLIKIALQNLLGNAWKYSSKKDVSLIEIGSMKQNQQLVYYIRDNGEGFNKSLADKIFEPFRRLHHETEFSGTGIGLSIAQRVIKRHGGKIWADAEPGEGATFYFTIDNCRKPC